MRLIKLAASLLLLPLLATAAFSLLVDTDWEVEHRLEIEASPATVWQLLADLDNYASWNSYSPNVSGVFAEGEPIVIEAKLGDRVQIVQNRIVSIVPEQELCWHSAGWYAPLSNGLRCRWLSVQDNGNTLLVHHEIMAGHLAWLTRALFFNKIHNGLRTVNESVAAEAVRLEQLASQN